MSVESVNNSSNHAGLWALGGAAVGAGAGAGAAYLTRPFLKDGAPTDSFKKRIVDNVLKNDEEYKQIVKAEKDAMAEIEKITNKEGLETYITKHGIEIPPEVRTKMNAASFEEARTMLAVCETVDFSKEKENLRLGVFPSELYEHYSDKTKIKNLTDEAVSAIKKAEKSIQGKYALIYGSIAAAVLGVGTYLATMGNKNSTPKQGINTQA